MIKFLITLILVNVIWLQEVPSRQKLLEKTNWPVEIRARMKAVTDRPGQQIKLAKDEQMQFGWEAGHIVTRPLLQRGRTYEVWRIDSDLSYYLIKADEWHWYWQVLSNKPVEVESTSQIETSKGYPLVYKFDYHYWQNDDGHESSSSMASIYAEKKWTLSRQNDVKFAVGLSFRHRTSDDWNQDIPMFKVKTSLDHRWRHFKVYGQANYYTSLDTAEPETLGEIYDEYSFLFPHGRNDFALSLAHFGSKSIVHDWIYSQAKIRAVYYLPKFFIGYEIGMANWQADDGYRTETRPLHGQILIGNWGQDFWWKISYGDAIRRKGYNKIFIKENDQRVFTFLVGTTLNRR